MAVKCFIRKTGRGQGNPLCAGPTGWFPRGPARQEGLGLRSAPPTGTCPLRQAHRGQACTRVSVHRWVCVGLCISRFPNCCIQPEGPRPLSSGRDPRGPPRGSFLLCSNQHKRFHFLLHPCRGSALLLRHGGLLHPELGGGRNRKSPRGQREAGGRLQNIPPWVHAGQGWAEIRK